MAEKKFKHTCECVNCGNEAEMVITCTLEQDTVVDIDPTVVGRGQGSTRGQAVCSQCGSEADIWLDI